MRAVFDLVLGLFRRRGAGRGVVVVVGGEAFAGDQVLGFVSAGVLFDYVVAHCGRGFVVVVGCGRRDLVLCLECKLGFLRDLRRLDADADDDGEREGDSGSGFRAARYSKLGPRG